MKNVPANVLPPLATVAELAARRRTDADVEVMRDCLRRMDEALAAETAAAITRLNEPPLEMTTFCE